MKKYALFTLLIAAIHFNSQTIAAEIMQYKVMETEKHSRAFSGKTEIQATIIPTSDQSKANQDVLVATVMDAAKKLQESSGGDTVIVRMECQDAANTYGEKLLAMAAYTPSNAPVWSNVRAAKRGYTAQELKYLSLWAELRGSYQKAGSTDDDALDAAIHNKMKLKPGTAKYPHNIDEPVAIK